MRIKCTVAYEGAAYCGWQTQKNGTSVQSVLEDALFRITNEQIRIIGAGRTDAGVNARGQVFHLDTDRPLPEKKWKSALNSVLPEDIRIVAAEEKNEFFHARYSVLRKQYDYRIHTGEYDIFTRHTAYQCPYPLDTARMEEASRIFLGTHDFGSFCSNSYAETPDQVRTVESIVFKKEEDMLTISYTGSGFLRYMVRMMTGALLECGRGRLDAEEIRRMLDHPDKRAARRNAAPEGLTLAKIDYYEILVRDRHTMIRKPVAEDDIAADEGTWVFTDNRTQKLLGSLVIDGECAVWAVKKEGISFAEDLLPVLRNYQPQLQITMKNEQ